MAADWCTRLEDAQIVDNIMAAPLDYRTTAVVAGRDIPELPGLDTTSDVRAVYPTPDEMRFEVHSRQPAFLVVAHNYYPGWTATVNGQPTQIYRTNYVGMGVLVPAGHSKIAFYFVTPGFRLGALVTVASLGLVRGVLCLAPRYTPAVTGGKPVDRFSVSRGIYRRHYT